VAIPTHWLVRRHWLGILVSATLSSLVNIAHEMIAHEFTDRPSDAFFWLPMLIVIGIVAALPAAAMTGLPFSSFVVDIPKSILTTLCGDAGQDVRFSIPVSYGLAR
ncbi:MAG TPA: hypothetical protein VMB21_12115, partial [Candidatus Limnocylindria bacterium]|nr:hypothetical protein [Candidatus Limnocylindria bacterium]